MSAPDFSRRRALAAMGVPMTLAAAAGRSDGSAVNARPEMAALTSIVSVADHGAVGNGKVDNTRAFQTALDTLAAAGGGRLIIPPGIFRTGTVHFPYEPIAVDVVGAGFGRTIWELASPDQPIIAIDPRRPPNRSIGNRFAAFSVRAHPDGRVDDEHTAIDCVGFSDVVFERLRFLSNGRGSIGSWFHTAAHPHLSYKQRFVDLVCEKNVGPGYVIRATNTGDAGTNTNLITVDGFWIYANEKMNTAFDLSNVTMYTVRGGLIESSGRSGIRLGNAGLVESVWIEDLTASPIDFIAGSTTTSSHNVIRNLYLSGFAGAVIIPRDCTDNILVNVTGGNFSILRQDALGGNVVLNSGGPLIPPRLIFVAGPRSSLAAKQVYRASGVGERWNLLYEIRPTEAGTLKVQVVLSPGVHLTGLQASALVLASGAPIACATGWPLGDLYITIADASPVAVIVQLTLD